MQEVAVKVVCRIGGVAGMKQRLNMSCLAWNKEADGLLCRRNLDKGFLATAVDYAEDGLVQNMRL